MKTARLVLLLVLAFHAFGYLAIAQSNGADDLKVLASGTVTLFSNATHRDLPEEDYKSAFCFRHQERSDAGRKINRNHHELIYGHLNVNGDSDWFGVSMGDDERSRIKDLGALNWNDIVNLPLLPLEAGREEGIRGPSKTQTWEESSKGRVTQVVFGHVYLFRSRDSKSDFHVLFRVEELFPSYEVTISWRVIRGPKDDRQLHHQAVSDKSRGANVTVVEKKWRMDLRNPALDKDPVEAMNERDRAERERKATERTNQILAERGMPAPTTQVPDSVRETGSRGIRVTYIYELKLTNTSTKAIRTLTWEYVFFEPGTEVEVGRRRFVSKVKIGTGKTTNLVERSGLPPVSSVNARQAGKKPREQYSEQIVIQSVEYDDGSLWQRPSQ